MTEATKPGEKPTEPSREDDARFDATDWTYPQGWTIPYYFTTRFLIWIVALVYFRLSIRGWRNIPAEGPVLLVSNHGSHLDPPLLSTVCRRRLAFLAKAELFENKVFAGLIGGLGAFPIKRGAGDRAALKTSVALLRKGYPMLMFPEGNRTTTGELGEAKTGVAMLLAQVPETAIVPVRIDGNFQAWPPGAKFPFPRRIRITVGKAFRVSDLKDLPEQKKQLYHEIGQQIMRRIVQAVP
jgi:1-acyl-sn-glycerol-3-phosphate acyltransferase